jgi:hypothetical protein
VNPTANARMVAVDLGKTAVKDAATRFEITGPEPQAHNVPGKPEVIKAVEQKLSFSNKLEAPAYSAELYRLTIK